MLTVRSAPRPTKEQEMTCSLKREESDVLRELASVAAIAKSAAMC
jgi:hypothetical protein